MTNEELVQTINGMSPDRIKKLFAPDLDMDEMLAMSQARRGHWARWVAENPERAGTTWPAALISYKEWRAAQPSYMLPLDILPCEHPNAAEGATSCPDCDQKL